jgi:penicillin-binding protein 2
MNNRLIEPKRLIAMAVAASLLLVIYLYFLYQLQIVQGEIYYNRSNELITTERTVTAARGNILDRYGRVLVSNAECYNLRIDTDKLFANDDPNAVILELVSMVRGYGDEYTDELPISIEPPFTYNEDMTAIQRTMLEAYFVRQGLDPNCSAVELMSYMRTRYNIDNSYSATEMRLIAGVRYSINVRYAINTADYVFVEDASMNLISSIMENKLVGIEVKRAYIRQYATGYGAHILGYVGLMTQEEF